MTAKQAVLAPGIQSFPKLLCCSRCFNAKTDEKRCKCRCGGTFHGKEVKKHDE